MATRPSRGSASQTSTYGSIWLVVLLDLTWATALSTQFVGARLGYHRHLGAWLFRAPAAAHMWFGLGSVACVTAALAMLLTVRWRWVALLFAFLSVSALVIRNGPIYAPTRVFLWYAAYRGIAVYAPIFHAAWLILAGASFMLVVATWRLMRAAAMPRAPSDPQRDPSRGAGGPSDMRPGGHAASAVRTPRRTLAPARRRRSQVPPI
jgi:hypothetical protein